MLCIRFPLYGYSIEGNCEESVLKKEKNCKDFLKNQRRLIKIGQFLDVPGSILVSDRKIYQIERLDIKGRVERVIKMEINEKPRKGWNDLEKSILWQRKCKPG